MNSVPSMQGPASQGDLVAAVPKDQLRSLFYLFAGKPDSRIQVFNAPIHIEPQDIFELNECVVRKLATHYIDLSITTVKVGYGASKFSEFSTWLEFESHKWQESETIEEIVVKWDFLVNIRDYAAPQRHTLLLRISRDFKPSQIFQMLGAGNADELDKIDEMSAPAFCRVDFINAQISKELTSLVEDWYKGRRTPQLIDPFLYWLKKRRNGIATIFDQWFVFSWALLISSIMVWIGLNYLGNNISIVHGAVATFLAIYSLRPVGKISHLIASRIYKSLSDIEGSKVVFDFTSGDKKRIFEQKIENSKQGRKFFAISAWNFSLNIVATIFYTYFFTSASSL